MVTSVFTGYGMKSGGILHVSAKEANILVHQGIVLVDLRPEHEVAHKSFIVPDEVLALIAGKEEIDALKVTKAGIFSITVTGDR